jgi:enamine deaminase RidA (YjgF/YER057c/UK114 family)
VERQIINPWRWQDAFGFVQANALQGVERMVVCAGQFASNAEGRVLHPGDMVGQIELALDNLSLVLAEAGLTLGHVVRLTYYTTDVDAFLAAGPALGARLAAAGCRPAATLLGVTRLAEPEALIEIEATAVA